MGFANIPKIQYYPLQFLKAKQPATNITGTVAKPSKPSVKLTAFDEPTIINIPNGMKNQPKLIIRFLKENRIFKSGLSAK